MIFLQSFRATLSRTFFILQGTPQGWPILFKCHSGEADRHLATENFNNSIMTLNAHADASWISARAPSNIIMRKKTSTNNFCLFGSWLPSKTTQKRMIKKPKRGNGPSQAIGHSCEKNPTLFCRELNGSSPFYIFRVSHVRDEGHLPPDLLRVHYNPPPLFFPFVYAWHKRGFVKR